MKQLLIAFACAPLIAFSQNNTTETPLTHTMQCFDRDAVINELMSTYKEKVIFTGNNEAKLKGSSSFLTYNEDKETFTIGIYVPNRNLICIVSTGYGALTPR